MDLIADASVIIKWFVKRNEKDRKQALEIKNQLLQSKVRVIIPDLMFYEVTNVLKMRSAVKSPDLKKTIKILFKYPFEIIWPSEELLKNAAKLAHDHDLTIYDAVYFAIARELGGIFITADQKLCQKINSPNARLLADFS